MKPADAFLVSCLAAAPSYAQSSSAPVQCALEEAKLLPATGFPKEFFGRSIAVSGDTVVVGSNPPSKPPNARIGAAYVFVETSSGQWSQQASLDPPGGMVGDKFGYAVAISGDTIVVGAPEVNGFNIDAGAAYVYVREGTLWSFQQKIQPGLPQEAHFGWAVAIEGDRLAVGSPEDLYPCPCPGSVYVYDRSGGSWTFVQRLTGSNGQPNYAFGQSVSISGDQILVGDSGSAYVFVRRDTSWAEETQLLSPNPFVGAGFGRSVSLSGDTAVVGARLDNCAGIDAGAAYVFVDQGTTWDLQGKLVGHDTTDGDWFGYSVSISGDTIVSGSCCDDDLGPSSGSAYLFCRESETWSESAKLLASDGSAVDGFGSAVSIDSETVASASATDDDNGQDSGSAYVFNLLREPVSYCTAKPNSCGTSPMISAIGAPSASDTSSFLVTGSNTRALKSGLLLYTDSGRGSVPFSGGTLCIGNTPAKRSIAVVDTTGTPGQCDGTLSIDMNAFATGSLGGSPLPSLTVPGTQINCQFWARDTIASGALLTDALEYFVCE